MYIQAIYNPLITQYKYIELSKAAGCWWKSPPMYMYLVSIGQLLRLAFLYGWRFLNKISLDWPLTLTVYFKTFWQPWVHRLPDDTTIISLFNLWALLSHLAFHTLETLRDTVWYFGLNKEKEHSSVKLPWLKSSTLFTKSNNLLHFGDVVCTKQFSLVIQTFERTYKSLITAAYCLGLHNSISFYIYIYFLSQVPVKPLYLFCLDQNVSKFTPNVSYKPTINCTLTAGNFFVFWIVFIAWRCFDMSIWFNFCASILQRHHLVHLWNSLPVSLSEARTAANILTRPTVTGCRTCRGLGNTNLFVTDMWLN